LKEGIARTPFDARKSFLDDPLRILRTIRFVARFDLEIDEEVSKALGDPEILVIYDYLL
jgi:tRNA nucleotidyltransferase (CCA-adding enzyme)